MNPKIYELIKTMDGIRDFEKSNNGVVLPVANGVRIPSPNTIPTDALDGGPPLTEAEISLQQSLFAMRYPNLQPLQEELDRIVVGGYVASKADRSVYGIVTGAKEGRIKVSFDYMNNIVIKL
jgi:hypothetical protein